MRNVSREVKRALNEDPLNEDRFPRREKGYIIYDKENGSFNSENLSHKQRILYTYIMSKYGQDLLKVYLIRGKRSVDDPLIKNSIENEDGFSLLYIKDYIEEDEIGLLVIYNDGDESSFAFYNTSKIRDRKEKTTNIYSYHCPQEPDVNSIVITTEDNDNIIDAEEYEVDITH